MKNSQKKGEIIIYQSGHKEVQLDVTLENESVWLNQQQMSKLFAKDVRTISEHIQSVYKEKELQRNTTVRKFRIVQREGLREIGRNVDFYNLDVIISVGYRVKSKQGTQFRIWAAGVLKDHLIKGYTINKKRIADVQLSELEKAVVLIKGTFEAKRLKSDEASGLLKVITDYAQSWVLLQRYDSEILETRKGVKQTFVIDYAFAVGALSELRANLMKKKETSNLFGNERGEMLKGILGNINQRRF